MAELDFDDVDVVSDGLDAVPEGDEPVVPEPDEPVAEEDEFEGGVPSEAEALAVAWNSLKVLLAVGLMAKTMPDSQ